MGGRGHARGPIAALPAARRENTIVTDGVGNLADAVLTRRGAHAERQRARHPLLSRCCRAGLVGLAERRWCRSHGGKISPAGGSVHSAWLPSLAGPRPATGQGNGCPAAENRAFGGDRVFCLGAGLGGQHALALVAGRIVAGNDCRRGERSGCGARGHAALGGDRAGPRSGWLSAGGSLSSCALAAEGWCALDPVPDERGPGGAGRGGVNLAGGAALPGGCAQKSGPDGLRLDNGKPASVAHRQCTFPDRRRAPRRGGGGRRGGNR